MADRARRAARAAARPARAGAAGPWVWLLAAAMVLALGLAATPARAQQAAAPTPASAAVQGGEAAPAAADPVLEARVLRVSAELRCLVCQNQTIADSHADLAVDLRRQVREMLARGDSEQAVIDYMTARYGDFVLYRPPLKGTTFALWFGPALLLAAGVLTLVLVLRRRQRLPADRFEPDEADDAPPDAPTAR